jgi:ankyrin repeat protein
MSLATLPHDIIEYEVTCLISFADALSLRNTNHFFNASFNYNHNPRLDNQSAIKLAVRDGNINAIKCLLKIDYVDPTIENNYPIKLAVRNGNVQVVKALLDSGKVDPSAEYNYPLRTATNGNLEMVRFLLDYPNFDLHNVNVTLALSEALKQRKDDIARLMISKISLTDGDFIMCMIYQYSVEGAAMLIKDSNKYITNFRETGSKLSQQYSNH